MTEHTDNPANHADSKYMDGLKREITKTLSTLFSDGDVIELRILSNGRVGSGYYTDRQALIDEVIRLEARKNANYQYYITLNELMPDVQHRRSGLKWGAEAHPTTTDADVIRRRWLLLDFDPERATGISATDEEKARAYAAMKLVRTWLAEHGFGAPIVADSGNGYHLLYLINIPADPATRDTENNRIIKQLLQAAADACNVEGVAIDLKVFNASRITKLYGTIARKGEHSKERPHRPSRLLAVPATLETVSVDLIKSVAHADSEGSLRKGTGAHSFNLGAWLDEHGIAVHKVKDEAEGTRYVLESCPFNHEHTDTAAYVIQFHNGAIAAKCHHDGCDGKNWSELRSKYEPDYAPDKPQERPANFELIDAWYNDTRTYRNQESVATLFARLCKDELCFSHELNRWIYYNGKYWEEDRKAHVVNLLIAVINDLIAVIDNQRPLESDDRGVRRKDEFFKWATHLKNRHSLESILHIAKAKLAVSLDEFDADDTLFNANNGTVDLLTGTLRPHDPRDKITLLCPVNYRPEAQYERWDTFLMETLGRYDYVRYLQKEFGYCLTGLTKEELLIMLYGLPNTGKSTFYEPVMRVLGNYGHHMEFATLKRSDKGGGGAPREDLLRLRTSRIVMCSEINPKTIFDTEKVKQICSGEPIVARGIRARHSVEFPPKFKVVIGTNYQPIVPYDDGGSFRRIKVNPFVNVPSVIDKDLKQHFMEFPEAQERILAWRVEGCLLWQREGLDDVPIEVERANAEYRRNQNVLSSFIEDYCVLDRRAGKGTEGTLARELVEAFNWHRDQYGLNELSAKSFGKYMAALGYKGYTDGQRRGYVGIRLKTDREIANDVGFYDVERQYDHAEEQQALATRRVVVRCACVHDLALTFDIYFALLITNNNLSSLHAAGAGTRIGIEGDESVYVLCQNGTINVKRQRYAGPRDTRSTADCDVLLCEQPSKAQERLQSLVCDAVSQIVHEYRGTHVRPDMIPSLVANHVERRDGSFVREDITTCLHSLTPREPVASLVAELTDNEVTGGRDRQRSHKENQVE